MGRFRLKVDRSEHAAIWSANMLCLSPLALAHALGNTLQAKRYALVVYNVVSEDATATLPDSGRRRTYVHC